MSSKRIQKRLDQLFTDIKQAEKAEQQEGAAALKPHVEVRPVAPEQRVIHARTTPPEEKKASGGALRSISPDTQPIPMGVATAAGALTVPFRTEPDVWSLLEVVNPPEKTSWSQEEQLLAKQVTDQLSLALENARLLTETQQRNKELATINEIIASASQTLELSQILDLVLTRVLAAIDMEAG